MLKDGQKLSQPGKWKETGQDSSVAWGLAQGSAKEPYKVCVELSSGAAKCNCPSRKFPCKHGAALMFMLARGIVETREGAAPEWAATWIAGRQKRQEAATTVTEKAPDPAAHAKREAARLSKVDAGITELRLFLEDVARQGFEDKRIKTYDFWDRIASRMVDAQMSPVGQRLRALGGKPFQKHTDWTALLADEIGRLYALTEAYGRIDSLPEGLQADVRTALGFSLKQEDLIAAGPAIRDVWQIVGQTHTQAERLTERHTWLYGESTGNVALLLEFSHANRAFSAGYPLGHAFAGELVYYPSAFPQRAIIKSSERDYQRSEKLTAYSLASTGDVLTAYADALAQNPFIERVPAGFARAYPSRSEIITPDNTALPVSSAPTAQRIQALGGGDWLPVFGEWDGEAFIMASFITTEGWISASET